MVNVGAMADDVKGAKKYKTTVNIQDKNDLEYLGRILSRDDIANIKDGKTTNWRGTPYEDMAKVNIVSETPKTIAQQLEGKVKTVKLKNDTFYHGTSAENAKGIMSSGFKVGAQLPESAFRGGGYGKMQNSISLTETSRDASRFSKLTRDGEIVEVKLKPQSKVVSIDDVEDAMDLEDFLPYLRKNKIDAVYIGGGEKELVVINPQSVIPSRVSTKSAVPKPNKAPLNGKYGSLDLGHLKDAGDVKLPNVDRMVGSTDTSTRIPSSRVPKQLKNAYAVMYGKPYPDKTVSLADLKKLRNKARDEYDAYARSLPVD
jgi:small nuclear ribonucleoprotein (snRNP)-like protein